MKRRLFLHLGLSKTGTTSIQSFLHGSPDFLAAHGVVYPGIASGGSAHPASTPSVLRRYAGREANHVALAMELRRRGGASPAEDIQTPLWSAILQQIDTGNALTAILSYENFYYKPELYRFDALATRLKDFDVRGIIYLRPQEDWFTSLYAQTIAGPHRENIPFDIFIDKRRAYHSYSNLLDSVRAYIPLNQLIVGDYEKASASGLLSDFMEKVGLSRRVPLPNEEQTRTNRSLPHWAVLFLLKCNLTGLSDEAFFSLRLAFRRGMAPDDIPHLKPGLDVATPKERQGLRDAAAADADRLRERYGITLRQRTREAVAYRPFDREDFDTIRRALAGRVPRATIKALDRI